MSQVLISAGADADSSTDSDAGLLRLKGSQGVHPDITLDASLGVDTHDGTPFTSIDGPRPGFTSALSTAP